MTRYTWATRSFAATFLASTGILSGVLPHGVRAETLTEAMAAAYTQNIQLQAQRLKTRAVDERLPEALSGYRPTVVGTASYGRYGRDLGSSRGDSDAYSYGVAIEQPLFDGFITKNSVRQSEADIGAARETLLALENDLLFETAKTYLTVLRDEGIVLFRRKALTALRREMVGVKARLDRGQATVTDLNQTQQRMASAVSDLEQASANLTVSKLAYARVTRLPASGLRMPALPKAHLPQRLAEAREIALRASPVVAAARFRAQSAKHAVSKEAGQFLPSANLRASYDRSSNGSSTGLSDDNDFSLVARLSVPLYQAGRVSARVRAAKHTAASADLEERDTQLQISQAVSSAWTQMKAARARLQADETARKAAEKALDGVREEQRRGQRSVLDVLDAEQALVQTRIRVLNSTRDLHVSSYAVLRSIGRLTIGRFSPGTEKYDPSAYTRAVRNKWFGAGVLTTYSDGLLGDANRHQKISTGRRQLDRRSGLKTRLGWSAKVQRTGARQQTSTQR